MKVGAFSGSDLKKHGETPMIVGECATQTGMYNPKLNWGGVTHTFSYED